MISCLLNFLYPFFKKIKKLKGRGYYKGQQHVDLLLYLLYIWRQNSSAKKQTFWNDFLICLCLRRRSSLSKSRQRNIFCKIFSTNHLLSSINVCSLSDEQGSVAYLQ